MSKEAAESLPVVMKSREIERKCCIFSLFYVKLQLLGSNALSGNLSKNRENMEKRGALAALLSQRWFYREWSISLRLGPPQSRAGAGCVLWGEVSPHAPHWPEAILATLPSDNFQE